MAQDRGVRFNKYAIQRQKKKKRKVYFCAQYLASYKTGAVN
jgi:hypothetical protein